eukprot:gnl/Chilomastix_cuspidata/3082.p1 GENE.gnl/Chilomastix_cuspidata/3082~~gnl/Chilomastix_cuspidata/3082.p1  ORF type:complete len:269 (+),score=49.16 gnl/Chilomastix_cuspidata/3082:104-910(+)
MRGCTASVAEWAADLCRRSPLFARSFGLALKCALMQGSSGASPTAHAAPPAPGFFAFSVEFVATGPGHNDREIALVCVYNEYLVLVYFTFVRPKKPVVSFLRPITGISREVFEQSPSVDLEECKATIRSFLQPSSVVVGQGIDAIMRALDLHAGRDFAQAVALERLFEVHNPQYRSATRFSLRHEIFVLFDFDICVEPRALHAPAFFSMRMFVEFGCSAAAREEARRRLLAVDPQPPIPRQLRFKYEGVCLSRFDARFCTCGQPPATQ